MSLSIVMANCIKQPLGKIWSSTHEKLNNTEKELKKNFTYKEACSLISFSDKKIMW